MNFFKWLLLFGFLLAFVNGQGEGTDDGDSDIDMDVSSTTTAAAIPDNNVNANYYYASFSGAYFFPYAVDKCTATSITGTSYMKATCLDAQNIEISTFTAATCSETSFQQSYQYNSTQADFRCDGTNDYVAVTIGISDCNALLFTIYAALDVCKNGGTYYVTAYCKGNYAELQYYATPTCDSATLLQTAHTTDTCDSSGFLTLGGGITLYGELTDCTVEADPTTTTVNANTGSESTTAAPGDSGSVIHFSIAGLFIATVLAALKL